MTLGFSTHWPKDMPDHMAGTPTDFVEKILDGLKENEIVNEFQYQASVNRYLDNVINSYVQYLTPKLHTIRADKNNRWKAGNKIHPVINSRTKNRFQFAPELEVRGIQKIEILNMGGESDVPLSYVLEYEFGGEVFEKTYAIWIDDDKLLSMKETETLAKNDGFDSVEDFFSWFKEDFTGKIIHWTDLKY